MILPREQHMQLEAFAGLWRIATKHPESSARRATMTEIMDHGSPSQVWYANKVPGFRWMTKEELPEGALYGMKYQTVVIDPGKFVICMRGQLEPQGVTFKRAIVKSLDELEHLGHGILINAASLGSCELKEVNDSKSVPARMQVILTNQLKVEGLYIHRGPDGYYSTAFARGDGVVWVGGILSYNNPDTTVYADQRKTVSSLSFKRLDIV
jgi:D-amino-acid oxidase